MEKCAVRFLLLMTVAIGGIFWPLAEAAFEKDQLLDNLMRKRMVVTKQFGPNAVSPVIATINFLQKLELLVEANPSTGYAVVISDCEGHEPFEQTLKDLDASGEFRPASTRPGAGGVYAFEFFGIRFGKACLNIKWERPWNKDVASEVNVVVDVVPAKFGKH